MAGLEFMGVYGCGAELPPREVRVDLLLSSLYVCYGV